MRPTGVLALLLASLPHGKARTAGSTGDLDTLAKPKLVVDLPTPGRREGPLVHVTQRTAAQARLFEHFGPAAYHATGLR